MSASYFLKIEYLICFIVFPMIIFGIACYILSSKKRGWGYYLLALFCPFVGLIVAMYLENHRFNKVDGLNKMISSEGVSNDKSSIILYSNIPLNKLPRDIYVRMYPFGMCLYTGEWKNNLCFYPVAKDADFSNSVYARKDNLGEWYIAVPEEKLIVQRVS